MMDMEFEKIKDEFDTVVVNTTGAREHVGEIERLVKFIKERARCVILDLRCRLQVFTQANSCALLVFCDDDDQRITGQRWYL